MDHALLLFGAGLLAGAMNAAAGGGSFVTLPALIFAGVPSVAANASSTVALFPGAAASVWAYRDDFRRFEGVPMPLLLAISLGGGLAGALLLLFTPQATFDGLVPWLLLIGTLAFAFGRQAGEWLRRHLRIGAKTLMAAQLALGVYAGYFGGAVGIMTLAVWSLIGLTDIKAMNAAKTLFVGVTNSVAVICFIVAGLIHWPQTLIMLLGAVAGGYSGARVARRLDPAHLRLGISVFNTLITALFFLKTYG